MEEDEVFVGKLFGSWNKMEIIKKAKDGAFVINRLTWIDYLSPRWIRLEINSNLSDFNLFHSLGFFSESLNSFNSWLVSSTLIRWSWLCIDQQLIDAIRHVTLVDSANNVDEFIAIQLTDLIVDGINHLSIECRASITQIWQTAQLIIKLDSSKISIESNWLSLICW